MCFYLKNTQFLPNLYKTEPTRLVILTKFHKDWAKIVDCLINAHFSMCPIFLNQTLDALSAFAGHLQLYGGEGDRDGKIRSYIETD